MPSAFHLIALPVATEEQTLAAAMDALADVEPGEAVFFSEAIAWTADGSGVAFSRLVRAARKKDMSLVASLNLGGELAEDLPGREPDTRYHALAIFTRHGDVHVPQAKVWPESFEKKGAPEDDAVPVSSYRRSNLVRLDIDEQLIDVRFLLGGDIGVLTDHPPTAFACDVLVALSRLPRGAEVKARATLADARAAGVASTTLLINGHVTPARGEPTCIKVEEAADDGRAIAAQERWPSTDKLQRRLYRYRATRRAGKAPAAELELLARDRSRAGRIPLYRPLRSHKVELGIYPITIVM